MPIMAFMSSSNSRDLSSTATTTGVATGYRAVQPPRHGTRLANVDVGELEHAVRGEELGDGDAADVAPVGPVIGGAHGGPVVGEDPAGRQLRPVGERGVARAEALLGGGGGGHDDHAAGPEAQLEDGAVAGGESRERAVEGLLEEVQVADERESGRPRRRVPASPTTTSSQ